MSKHKTKRALSAHPRTINNSSHVPCEGCDSKRFHLSPEQGKGRKREKRCVSVKQRSQVVSFEASKASSVRKPKQKSKKKTILVMSEHDTPVLGKYFIANSQHQLPQTAQMHSISDHAAQDHPNQDQSKITVAVVEDSSVKAPLSIKSRMNRSSITKIEEQGELDQTIDKLKSKQETIQILKKTIQTRLVDVGACVPRRYMSREDTYQVQMNFYVEKITLLQKQLYEKNRLLRAADTKNEQFSTLARNTKKLIRQNTRLKDELELSVREVTALKKLLIKTEQKLS